MKVTIVGEVGINHQGDVNLALVIIEACKRYGVDMVKFQKRTPDLCVPEAQKHQRRDTIWGEMSYIDYRRRIEFDQSQYDLIDEYCRTINQPWFMSVWDSDALEFALQYNPPYIKIPSAKATDLHLISNAARKARLILSTGGCDLGMVKLAAEEAGDNLSCLMHCTSTYPVSANEVNLSCITTYKNMYPDTQIGYSNHFPGMTGTLGAIALGATMVEVHVTPDITLKGTDHASSCPLDKLPYLVKHIRTMEQMIGDGNKVMYDSERPVMAKLRGR